MLPDKRNMLPISSEHDQFDSARAFFEMLPGAVSLSNRDRSFCLLNQAAKQLIKYSEVDFVNRPCLWMERIHPDDKPKFCRSMEELGNGRSLAQCDYRFFPRDAKGPLWIREHSVLRGEQNGDGWEIISAYTDISDLNRTHAAETNKYDVGEIARALIHDFQNSIQKVSLELELALMDLKRKFNFTDIVSAVDSINHSLQDLRGQAAKVVELHTRQDPWAILDSIMTQMHKELDRRHVDLRLVHREPLPMVKGDKNQLRRALEHVFEFCGSMLKDGGNLEIEARRKEVKGQTYVEVKIIASSSASIELADPQEITAPDGRRSRVGLQLAREILRRSQGRVSLRKETDNRGRVTVLIKAS